MAPRAAVDEGLGVEAVDGVRHPVVEVQDVLDGDVGPAPAGTAYFTHAHKPSGTMSRDFYSLN